MESIDSKFGTLIYDIETSLGWKKYNKSSSDFESVMNDQKIDNIVDEWSKAPNVSSLLISGNSLVSMFHAGLGEYNNIYYAIENDDVVGVAMIREPSDNYDFSSIEYLVVNPEFQYKGVGTRMVASIKNNPEFFVGNKHKGRFIAYVRQENEPSKKVFLKNKFDVVKKADSYITGVFRFIYNESDKEISL